MVWTEEELAEMAAADAEIDAAPLTDEERQESARRDREAKHKTDKVNERQRAYYEQNKDKVNERQRAYREQNKDKVSEYQRAYREQNKALIAMAKEMLRKQA